jgi:anti-sigma B factor antagonist
LIEAMKLPTEIFGNVVVVHAPEEVSDDNADNLVAFLTSQERSQVILDLDGTETFDSQGLTALLKAQESLRESSGDLKISTANNINQKILEITRLDQHLDVFDSVIDAVRSFAR